MESRKIAYAKDGEMMYNKLVMLIMAKNGEKQTRNDLRKKKCSMN